MKVQVLIATMHQKDHSLLEKMNIQSDAIVGNQCDRNEVEDFTWNDCHIKYLNFAERGVGLNRNNALMRADADICLFADDDMVYEDGYVEKIQKAFLDNPEADVIVFNLNESIPTRKIIKKRTKVGYFNFLRYGTARIAIKLTSIKKNGIYFNQCFGGGTEHCHGEDNLFLATCLQKGLIIYAVPEHIASLKDVRESSWNVGYNEKYLRDQGVLYKTMFRRCWKFFCLQDAMRHKKKYNRRWWKSYILMTRN